MSPQGERPGLAWGKFTEGKEDGTNRKLWDAQMATFRGWSNKSQLRLFDVKTLETKNKTKQSKANKQKTL